MTDDKVPAPAAGLKVIDDACEISGTRGEICIEGDTIEEVHGAPCRELVIKKATALGLHRPGFSGGGWTEWVDPTGTVLHGDAFRTAPVKRCRIHYPVQAGI